MFDMTLIQGTIATLKAAGDIANSLIKLKSKVDVQGKVIELQSTILAAQTSALAAQSLQSSMIQRIGDLEEEVANAKAWEETKQRYELYEPSRGIFVWRLKEQSEPSEPAHWICTKCYEEGKRSIIQVRNKDHRFGITNYICFVCKNEFHLNLSFSV